MKFTIAAVLIALASQAAADHTGKPYKPASEVLMPPPQFDVRLVPYTGKLTVLRMSHANVWANCGTGVLACAKRYGWPGPGFPARECKVFIPKNIPADLLAALRVHEISHCNGWVH